MHCNPEVVESTPTLAALEQLLASPIVRESLPHAWQLHGASVLDPPPLYQPLAAIDVPPMAELRRLHRVWLAPHTLDCARATRSVTPSLDESDAPLSSLVLVPIQPARFVTFRGAGVDFRHF